MKGLRLIPPNRPIVLPRRPTNYELWTRREREREARQFARRLAYALASLLLLGFVAARVLW